MMQLFHRCSGALLHLRMSNILLVSGDKPGVAEWIRQFAIPISQNMSSRGASTFAPADRARLSHDYAKSRLTG